MVNEKCVKEINNMKRELETDRLILRTVTTDDAEAIFKWT